MTLITNPKYTSLKVSYILIFLRTSREVRMSENDDFSGGYIGACMRNAFVLKLDSTTIFQFVSNGTPFPICQETSMIDRRVRKKTISTVYPLQNSDFFPVHQMLRIYNRFNKLRSYLPSHLISFQPLNFFERVLFYRIEYITTATIEMSRDICTKKG